MLSVLLLVLVVQIVGGALLSGMVGGDVGVVRSWNGVCRES